MVEQEEATLSLADVEAFYAEHAGRSAHRHPHPPPSKPLLFVLLCLCLPSTSSVFSQPFPSPFSRCLDPVPSDPPRTNSAVVHRHSSFFGKLTVMMSSGPILKLRLSKAGGGAVPAWRALLGPTNSQAARDDPATAATVRALYGVDKTLNAAHGSDSAPSAARELALMFPNRSFCDGPASCTPWLCEGQDVRAVAAAVVPGWAGQVATGKQIIGGITNALWKLQAKGGEKVRYKSPAAVMVLVALLLCLCLLLPPPPPPPPSGWAVRARVSGECG